MSATAFPLCADLAHKVCAEVERLFAEAVLRSGGGEKPPSRKELFSSVPRSVTPDGVVEFFLHGAPVVRVVPKLRDDGKFTIVVQSVFDGGQ